jgi:hypothetical protein
MKKMENCFCFNTKSFIHARVQHTQKCKNMLMMIISKRSFFSAGKISNFFFQNLTFLFIFNLTSTASVTLRSNLKKINWKFNKGDFRFSNRYEKRCINGRQKSKGSCSIAVCCFKVVSCFIVVVSSFCVSLKVYKLNSTHLSSKN